MYPTKDMLVLRDDEKGIVKIIPVKESTYNLICRAFQAKDFNKFVSSFLTKNPHLASKINESGIIIKDNFIYWNKMIEVMEVNKDTYPSDLSKYCKPPRSSYNTQTKSGPLFYYDYHADHYEYFGCGYSTVEGMWNGIWSAICKPKYVLIYE